MFDQPLVFVDIETNGLSSIRGRVIEVAAIRVEHGAVVKEFSSLVDPESDLPYFITNLTGITTNDVRHAPTFHQIASELGAVMDGAVFVAHNVRFDYSFLKQEFKRLGQQFVPKQICTVKLSHALYPYERGHKLADLIARHNLAYTSRHRAYDDAAILWQFMQHLLDTFPLDRIEAAIAQQIHRPAIPRNIAQQAVNDLPASPGVYIFEDEAGQPLYVGKSINVRQRVLDHFSRDHAQSKEFKIAQTVHHVRSEQTSGELSALLLESRLVKDLQPVFNRQLRRMSKLLLVKQVVDDGGYITVELEESSAIDPVSAGLILAVYPSRMRAKDALSELTKTFDLCPKLLGLEKIRGACFSYQLHKCRGACVGKETAENYNQRLLTAFEHQRIRAWPYKGPMLVEEQHAGQAYYGIVVDKWCILSEITQEPFCEPVIKAHDFAFDLDTYKILQTYLTHKLRHLNIKPLTHQQMTQFGF